MISLLKQVIHTKNKWGLKPLVFGALYELFFLIRHPRFKYLFVIEPEDLDISSEDSKLSDPYVPSPYYVLTKSVYQITHLMNNFSNSIFIDIGCGPGRAMYYASTLGFERLIGIEQSKKLTDLCNQNLIRYLPVQVRSKVLHQNVKHVTFSELIDDFHQERRTDSLVFFLYTPFKDEMLRIFLGKLDELDGFDCYIIFFGPQDEYIMTEKSFSVIFTYPLNPDTPIKIYSRGKSPEEKNKYDATVT